VLFESYILTSYRFFFLPLEAQKEKAPKRKMPMRLRARAVAFEKAPQNFSGRGAVRT
jgi:hypothetical protein